MIIQDIFQRDINRNINGVVQVEQSQADIVAQEIDEYVVTSELYKHFSKFFEEYCDALSNPTDNCGVWISGFFGSGKSHFLKMLSYLLSNKTDSHGISVLQQFEPKFAEFHDALSWNNIKRAVVDQPTETILFNIQSQENSTSGNKGKNPVLSVFAKVFFKHLGYYGDNLEVVRLEQFLQKEGKYQEFEDAFAEVDGNKRVWRERRNEYRLLLPKVRLALQKVMGYTTEEVKQCLDSGGQVGISVESLAEEVKQYVLSQPQGFRLVFLLDEVGQFVAEHIDYLLTLQTIVEKLGSVCQGRVWVICTAQDRLDDIKKNIKQDEFSKISARFPIRLDLTSGSAREVIEKRILAKNLDAKAKLVDLYHYYEGSMFNLFSFRGVRQDVLGYTDADEFVRVYPFVPYQFELIKQVFGAIRKHSNSGRHMSGGERSMLSGFQEAAQAVQQGDLGVLSPFVSIYDTIQNQLDSKVREVINRCQMACENRQGLHPGDSQVLKLLYLVRYIDDMPANAENLLAMSISHLHTDKLAKRDELLFALDRLIKEHYVARVNDKYQFLTDLEQDIQREIDNTIVPPEDLQVAIVRKIKQDILRDTNKHNFHDTDFPFNIVVDESSYVAKTGAMVLKFITPRFPGYGNHIHYMAESYNGPERCEALIVLGDDSCMSLQERIRKIEMYLADNLHPADEEQIIQATYREEMKKLNTEVTEKLSEAIRHAKVYVNGNQSHLPAPPEARTRISQALDVLVKSVYTKIDLVVHNYTLQEVSDILKGEPRPLSLGHLGDFEDLSENSRAYKEILDDLEMAKMSHMRRTVFEVKERLLKLPFGWKEVDVAGLLADLWVNQEVRLKCNNKILAPDDPDAIDYVYRKEVKTTFIQRRERISDLVLQQVRQTVGDMGRDCFKIDEDKVYYAASQIIKDFYEQWKEQLLLCQQGNYPGQEHLKRGISIVEGLLDLTNDANAFLEQMAEQSSELVDVSEKISYVNSFLSGHQREIFVEARKQVQAIAQDLDRLTEPTREQLSKVQALLELEGFNFGHIPELNDKNAILTDLFQRDLKERRRRLDGDIVEAANAVVAGAKQVLENSEASEKWREKAQSLQAGFESICHQLRQKAERTEGISQLDSLAYQLSLKLATTLRNLHEQPAEIPVDKPIDNPKEKTQPQLGNTKPINGEERSSDADLEGKDPKLAPPAPPAREKSYKYKCPVRLVRNKAEAEVYLSQVRHDLLKALEKAEQVEIN